jgi:aminoglycoside 6'-N-acetyltransferase
MRPTVVEDLDLLGRWFADPNFVAWWGDRPKSREEVERKYVSPGDGRRAFVIEADGNPIGYIQAWSDEPPDGGIDLVLVREMQGRGLGVDAARSLARSLRAEGWRRIIADPLAANGHAIKAFEKAGFVRECDENEHVILSFEPDATVLIGGTEPGSNCQLAR